MRGFGAGFGIERSERSLRQNRKKSREKKGMVAFIGFEYDLLATSTEVWVSLEHILTCRDSYPRLQMRVEN